MLCGPKPEEGAVLPYGAKKGLAERSDASIMRLQEGRPIKF